MADKQLQVSVASLQPADKDGWCTKQGGSIKTWKRRWFVLKEKRLWYFKGRSDTEAMGFIDLEPTSQVKDESEKKKPMFSISARGPKGHRVFLIKPDTQPEVPEWIEAIKRNISGKEAHGTNLPPTSNTPNQTTTTPPSNTTTTTPPSNTTPPVTVIPPVVKIEPAGPLSDSRAKLNAAKSTIPFLQDPESKVLEFWQIWCESIPPRSELVAGQAIDFLISVSAEMEKLTWRTCGPQNLFIQKMVDFFWNVGAPESEIDKLNDVGALINPIKIGSWIDMSGKGGMDGGWYFPVDIATKLAIEAADSGDPTKKVTEWCETHNVAQCYSVGRDMGAAPPRQTEMRMRLPGGDFTAQLTLAIDAFATFGFPPLPEQALSSIRASPTEGLCLSIITASDGFVRLGMLCPRPSRELVGHLVEQVNGKPDGIARLEAALGNAPPSFIELQYLMKGFGYSVYKEGFDVVIHWSITPEESGP
ncbi:hypothetical protein Pelo_11981 [Pelomyxa schiedti]|nr:hypothetical protein Pelo_11981 [Pelomyxa schiedti]